MAANNIDHVLTSPNHPQGNGVAERFIRTLVEILAKKSRGNHMLWDEHLPDAVCAYLDTVHSTTGIAPRALVFETNAVVLDEVRRRIQGVQARRKEYFDRTRSRPRKIEIGDKVFVYDRSRRAGRAGKLACPWVGPFVVADVSPQSVVCSNDSGVLVKHSRYNVIPAVSGESDFKGEDVVEQKV